MEGKPFEIFIFALNRYHSFASPSFPTLLFTMSTKLYVGNLSWNTSVSFLQFVAFCLCAFAGC